MSQQDVPVFWQYMQPIVEVLRELGGSGTIQELEERVPSRLGLSVEQLAVRHDPERGKQSEVGYRMAWARTYLRKVGLIENRVRGVWALTADGKQVERVDGAAIAQQVRSARVDDESEEATPDTGARPTYLLAWNPKNFAWSELDAKIRAIQVAGFADETWSCGKAKNLVPGARFFMIRLGTEPRGLVGAGSTLDAPREEAHWDKERAADGATTHFVDIRFDALSRVPLVARSELDSGPFDGFKWDTQMSGIRIPDEAAVALESVWKRRLEGIAGGLPTASVQAEVIERWRSYASAAQADAEWVERHRLRDSKRSDALPEIRALVVGFIRGSVSLVDFRETFDHKTRNEWDLFGLKGLSGAMFLNKFAKYLNDAPSATTALQRALPAPSDEADARVRLDGLMGYLDEQIAADIATASELQINRAPFFVSACWHVQQPVTWPIMYHSSCEALQSDGLLGRTLRRADGYLQFRRVFRELADGLGASFWELEHLCVRLATEPTQAAVDAALEADSTSESNPPADRQRVWLIAPGPGANKWNAFHEEGIVAIGWGQLGDLSQYPDLESIRRVLRAERVDGTDPMNNALACHEFAREMQIGDAVFAKRGQREIVGYGVVTSEYRYEPNRTCHGGSERGRGRTQQRLLRSACGIDGHQLAISVDVT